MKKEHQLNIHQSGQAVLTAVIFFLVISLPIVMGVSTPVTFQARAVSDFIASKQGYVLADSLNDDVLYRLNNGQTLPSTIVLGLNNATATAGVTSSGGVVDILTSGLVGNNITRVVRGIFRQGVGISLNYAIQAGDGGINFSNGSGVNGSVYSEGSVVGDDNSYISGSATVSSSTASINGSYSGAMSIGNGVYGDSFANAVMNTKVSGNLYCQTGSGNINWTSASIYCNTSRANPISLNFPITDNQIQAWKDNASNGSVIHPTAGQYVLDGTSTATLGPAKIVGNLDIKDSAVVTLGGNLWVTGNITIEDYGKIQLASSFDSNSSVVLADKKVLITGGSQVVGTGVDGSYVMVVDTSNCPEDVSCGSQPAILTNGWTGSALLVAPNGSINLDGGTTTGAIIGKKVSLLGTSTVMYGGGLIKLNFYSINSF